MGKYTLQVFVGLAMLGLSILAPFWFYAAYKHRRPSAVPELRHCTFSVGETKVEGALHEQENGKFCIPFAD